VRILDFPNEADDLKLLVIEGQNREHERLQKSGTSWTYNTQANEKRKRQASHNKNTYSLLHNITTDKHGVPPTKRLFRVTKLDPIPEFICPWGRFGDPGQPILLARENLQSRIKEEDLITDVENAVFDLGVMDPLSFLLVNQRILIGMITKFV
ncbi:hypothetical protein Tco_0323500, partial [Tanacetum coccineum]